VQVVVGTQHIMLKQATIHNLWEWAQRMRKRNIFFYQFLRPMKTVSGL